MLVRRAGLVPALARRARLPAWGINAMLFPGLAALYEVVAIASGRGHAVGVAQLRLPAILFATVLVYIGLQTASWTPAALHHPIWPMAAEALEVPVSGSVSVDRDLTQLAFLRLLTAAAAFWLALQLCRDARRADLLLKGVALISTAYALFGLVDFSFAMARPHDPVYVRATFVNRNSFATYAGIGLMCSFGLIRRQLQERAGERGSIRAEILAIMESLAGRGALWFACAIVLVIALLLT